LIIDNIMRIKAGAMDEMKLLLRAYYECLHERLKAAKQRLPALIEKVLQDEIEHRGFAEFEPDKYAAYYEASLAFVDERLETYNPIGIQYMFENVRSKEAYELELQLDWYDSRPELEALKQAIRAKVEKGMDEETLSQTATELIKQVGAFPDESIIAGYEATPAVNKLPDYVVARVIEEIIS